jgi:hypothetical protein
MVVQYLGIELVRHKREVDVENSLKITSRMIQLMALGILDDGS